jgi:hypothetical protein
MRHAARRAGLLDFPQPVASFGKREFEAVGAALTGEWSRPALGLILVSVRS